MPYSKTKLLSSDLPTFLLLIADHEKYKIAIIGKMSCECVSRVFSKRATIGEIGRIKSRPKP